MPYVLEGFLLDSTSISRRTTSSVVLQSPTTVAAGISTTYTCTSSGTGPDPQFVWSIRDSIGNVITDLTSSATAIVDNNPSDGSAVSQATFTMLASYLDKTIWCGAIDSGSTTTSVQIYTAIFINCGPVNQLANGTILFVSVNGSTTVGAIVTFSCDEGYKLIGGNQSTCQKDGTWTIPHPECKKLCKPFYVVNGNISPNTDITVGTRVRIRCNEGYTLVGMPANICMADGSWRVTFPLCRSDCGHLSQLDHGDIYYVNGSAITSQGALVTFSCDLGYQLKGVNQSTCQADGQWSGKFPECERDCGGNVTLHNGKATYPNGTTFGSTLTYTCDRGYTLKGSMTSYCNASGMWDKNNTTCDIKDCGKNVTIANANVTFPNGSKYGVALAYICHEGYDLVNTKTFSCEWTGYWTNITTVCIIKDCGGNVTLFNGNATYPNGTTFGSTLTYTCDRGYTLKGSFTSYCNATGMWDKTNTTCDIKDCGGYVTLRNGNATYPNGTTFGSTLTYTCDRGYTLKGSMTSYCNASGIWDKNNTTCDIKDCGKNLTIANANVTFPNGSKYGAALAYTCHEGYDLVNTKTFFCEWTGYWTNITTVCIIKDCGGNVTLYNGNVTYPNGTTFGSTLTYTCDRGYTLKGSLTSYCNASGMWDTTNTTCDIKDCGQNVTLPNANVTYPNGSKYGAALAYTCHEGYDLVNTKTFFCEWTGVWTNITTVCKIKDCGGYVTLHNGNATYPNGTTFGSTLTFTCDRGYTLEGSITSYCNATGMWDTTNTICNSKDCGRSVSLNNGNVTYPSKTTIGSMLTFTCHDGYTLEGSNTSYCDTTGTWNNTVAICKIKACTPLHPVHGSVTPNNDTSIGVRVTYACDQGYKLFGFSGNRCMPDGNWAVPLPFCTVDCGRLDHLAHENMSYIYGDGITTLGAVVTFSCDEGYQLIGDNTSECQADGHWSSPVPDCKIIDCGPPQPLAHEIVSYVNSTNKTTFGESVKFSCDEGYYLVGSSMVTCQADGRWSIQVPVCRIIECERKITLAHGDVSYPSGSTYGSKLTFRCDAGYTLEGPNTAYCDSTGTWKNISTVCKIKDCGRSLTINNGNITYPSTTTFGSMLTFSCQDGFIIEGSNTSYCDSTGTWNNTETICKIKACSPLHPAHGSVTPYNDTSIGVQVRYSCEQGYTLFGFSRNRCMPDGNWAVPLPLCQVDCGRLDHLAHENISYIYGDGITTLGAVVTFICDEGYQVVGDNTSECQADGHWSASVPECKIIDCGHLNQLGNGSFSYVGGLNSTLFGAIVTFSCEEGYLLVGDNQSTCQADGRWSALLPKCEITCKPVDLAHGHVTPSSNVTAGRIVDYSCDDGYTLIGFVRNQCMPDGHWAVPFPECKRGCRRLYHPSHGKISYIYGEGITTFGAVVTFTCDEGYNLIGDDMSICKPDGHWSAEVPECRIKDCGHLHHLDHGNITYVNGTSVTDVGALVRFRCDEGYQLIGDSQSVCQADGHWSFSSPECKIKL